MALDSNMSSWMSMKVYDELQHCCEIMNLEGQDRKVYEMCMKDFWDYMGYLKRNTLKVEEEQEHHAIMEIRVTQDMFGFQTFHTEIKGIDTKEVDEFVHMWVQSWWKKYHERCKIVFKLDKEPPHLMGVIELQAHFTDQETKETLEMLTDTYIKYGEICCPSILADQLFRRTVQASGRKDWKSEDKINLIIQMQKEARHMSYLHGALIFIRPDRNFFLREWRNDGANKII